MPVTAKLSQELCNRLGEQVAGELVDWFNSVDLAYRTDLRELNELNFVRFDAKLEQRIGSVGHAILGFEDRFRAQLELRFAEQEAWIGERFEAQKARIGHLEARLGERFEEQKARIGHLEARLGERFAEQEARLNARLFYAAKWFIIAWVTQTAAILGLWVVR